VAERLGGVATAVLMPLAVWLFRASGLLP